LDPLLFREIGIWFLWYGFTDYLKIDHLFSIGYVPSIYVHLKYLEFGYANILANSIGYTPFFQTLGVKLVGLGCYKMYLLQAPFLEPELSILAGISEFGNIYVDHLFRHVEKLHDSVEYQNFHMVKHGVTVDPIPPVEPPVTSTIKTILYCTLCGTLIVLITLASAPD